MAKEIVVPQLVISRGDDEEITLSLDDLTPYERTIQVRAMQVDAEVLVTTDTGFSAASPGDYITMSLTGELSVIPRETFELLYFRSYEG